MANALTFGFQLARQVGRTRASAIAEAANISLDALGVGLMGLTKSLGAKSRTSHGAV